MLHSLSVQSERNLEKYIETSALDFLQNLIAIDRNRKIHMHCLQALSL